MDTSIAIFVPSLNRPHKLERLVNSIRENTKVKHKIYFVISDDESANILDNLGVNFWRDDGGTWIERNNFLYEQTDEPYIFLASDDLKFTPNWDIEALKVMEEVDGVVPVNDLHNPNGTSALVSRNYIQEMSCSEDTENTLVYPGYNHNYADTELFNVAKKRKRFAYAARSCVEHLHHAAGKAKFDDTYRKSDLALAEDTLLYKSRN